jgi:hypothetical protein
MPAIDMRTPSSPSWMRRALAFGIALASLATLAPPALAHGGGRARVAVLEIRIEGDAAPELRDQLDKSLAGGLSKAGWEVVSRLQVQKKLDATPELVGCMTTTCLEAIGAKVGTSRFVRVRVSATGAAYTVELELLAADVATGPIARMEKSCAPCTFDEANEMMSAAAAQLREGAGDKVLVRVSSEPPGAVIEVDGKPLGVAPLEEEMLPGDHVFRAKLAGRADALVTASVTRQPGGDAQTVALSLPDTARGASVTERTLPAPGHEDDTTPPPGGPYRVWKWVAAGTGAAAIIAGLWLIGTDGDGIDCPAGGGECPYTRDSALSGTLLTVAGVGLGGVATWMFLHDQAPPPATPDSGVVARPVVGGAMVYFHKTF